MATPSQWPQGNTHSLFPVQLVGADGVTGVDLTGVLFASISLAMAPVTTNGAPAAFTPLAGAVTSFTDVVNGKFNYKFTAADVATPGAYDLVIVVNYGAGDILRSLPMTLTIVRTV